MTDPNPLKQAAEEAKARKLAEVANAAVSYEARLREAVATQFDVVDGPLHIQREEQSVRFPALEANFDIPAGLSDQLNRMLDADSAEESAVVYMVRPKSVLSGSGLTRFLAEDDLVPCGLRDLISVQWSEAYGDSHMYALGADPDGRFAAIRGIDQAGGDVLDIAPPGDGWGPGQLLLVRLGPRAQARVDAVMKTAQP